MHVDFVFNNRKSLIGTQVSVKGCLSCINNEWWIVDTIAEVRDSASSIRLQDSVRPPLTNQDEDIKKQRDDAFLERFEAGDFSPLSKDDIVDILRDTTFEGIKRLHQAQAEDAVVEYITRQSETAFRFFNGRLTYISSRLIDVWPLVWPLAEVYGQLIEDEQGFLALSDIGFLYAANDSISIAMPQMLVSQDDTLSVYDLMENPDTHANHEVRVRGYLIAEYILIDGEAAQKIYSLAPNQLYMWIGNPFDQSIHVRDKSLTEFFAPFEEVRVGGIAYLITENVIITGQYHKQADENWFFGQLNDVSEIVILRYDCTIHWKRGS